MSLYDHAEIVLATKHHKERVIRKPFLEEWTAHIFVPTDYDTDQFGTFSGEIERKKSAYETVIEKAKNAAIRYGFDYAIGSEGSFGPHPTLFFVPCDIELMSFIDFKNGIEVVESEMSTDTNYGHIDIKAQDSYDDFLNRVKFPSHALIVRSMDNNSIIRKGITDVDELKKSIHVAFSKYETVRLETDMRAMMNPTRMTVIHNLAMKLVKRLKHLCKKCGSPGFGKVSFSGNLSCRDCGLKTTRYENRVLSCLKCDYEEKLPRPDFLKESDPMYCSYCNP